MSIPDYVTKHFREKHIQERVLDLGREITPWAKSVYQDTGKQVLAICILRGAVFFFADLLKKIDASVEPTFCRTWSYADNQAQHEGVRISMEDVVAEGRSILVVDDICDTGRTLKKLENVFLDLGAVEVKTAVLIHRLIPESAFRPTYVGLEYDGPEWFVGYGMDDNNTLRNLPWVGIIKK